MSDGETVAFALSHLTTCTSGTRVLEIGSRGSNLRDELERLGYQVLGVDLLPGPHVDLVADVTRGLPDRLNGQFDSVLCMEVLEHVYHPRALLLAAIRALKPGGQCVLSAPSPGYPYHEAPVDVWRYTEDDFRDLLATADVCTVKSPGARPAVLACARIGTAWHGVGFPDAQRIDSLRFLRRLDATARRSIGAWVDFARATARREA